MRQVLIDKTRPCSCRRDEILTNVMRKAVAYGEALVKRLKCQGGGAACRYNMVRATTENDEYLFKDPYSAEPRARPYSVKQSRKRNTKLKGHDTTGHWPIKFVRLCTQNGFSLLLANCSPGSV